MVTVNDLRTLAFFVLALGWLPQAAAENLIAHVDRTSLNEGETLTLTVETDTQVLRGKPDFSAIEPNFKILSQQQGTHQTLSNGQVSAKTTWSLTLMPKQTGYVVIPGIEFRGQTTEPIPIKVEKASAQSKPSIDTDKPVFVRVSVDKDKAYVQSQLLLTVQIFHKRQLNKGTLSDLNIQNAIVEKLGGKKSYQARVKGVGYNVIELQYTVFPQKSGTLEIPSVVFKGNIAERGRSQSLFSPFLNRGHRVVESSAPIKMKVLPKPDEYPANAAWLPAENVSISESWSPGSPEFTVGEPVTRIIVIKAEGQSANSIPPLPDMASKHYKAYTDQAQTEDKQRPDGLVGVRTESIAMVPTQAGHFTLPSITVYWWDTNDHKLRQATLPSKEIKVKGNGQPSQDAVKAPTIPKPAQSPNTTENQTTNATVGDPPDVVAAYWKVISLVLGTLWLITLVLLILQIRRRPRILAKGDNPLQRPKVDSTKSLRSHVYSACDLNDPERARDALIALAKRLNGDKDVYSLGDCKRVLQTQDAARAINELEACLYRGDTIARWKGQPLKQAVEAAMKTHDESPKQKHSEPVEPLYT